MTGYTAPRFTGSYTVQENDLRDADRAVPGSLAAFLRWPVVFTVVLARVVWDSASATPDAFYPYVFAGIVVELLIIGIAFGNRGSRIRRTFRSLPSASRTLTVLVSDIGIRIEDGDRNANECPWAQIASAIRTPLAFYLASSGRLYTFPRRAFTDLEALQAYSASQTAGRLAPVRSAWSRDWTVNAVLWSLTVAGCLALDLGIKGPTDTASPPVAPPH